MRFFAALRMTKITEVVFDSHYEILRCAQNDKKKGARNDIDWYFLKGAYLLYGWLILYYLTSFLGAFLSNFS